MNADALIGSLVRRFNRQVMTLPEAKGGRALPAPRPGAEYLLYLHIPFCTVLCPFCSFHRVHFEQGKAHSYFDLLRREIALATDSGFRFSELYVGGGTPTVLPDELVSVIGQVRDRHPLGPVSVETNPDHLDDHRLGRLRDAGVSRLSVGVQSFDDALLSEMGRLHKYGSGEEIATRLERHRSAIDTLNVDMIFNLPHQSEASLNRDLDMLIDRLAVDQVSFYPLMAADTVKQAIRKHMGRVTRDNEKRFYTRIVERMLAAGYRRESAWCFSRDSGQLDEYIARREEYVGLGSGAFSYVDGRIVAATFSLDEYRDLVTSGRIAGVRSRRLGTRDQMRYYLLVTLFSGTLDVRAAEQRFDGRFRRTLWFELSGLRAIGAIGDRGESLVLTENGYYLWVVLMREFFTGINSLRDELRYSAADHRAAPQGGIRT